MLRPTIPHIQEGTRDHLLYATARLGLPLYYHVLPDQQINNIDDTQAEGIQGAKDAGALVETEGNRMLHLLSTKTSPSLATTQHVSVPDNTAPIIVLTRADGKDMSDHQVKLMWLFIHTEMTNVVATKVSIHERLIAENFIKFWNLADTNGEACPVSLACKGCGADKDNLLRCGKCGSVKYCDTECQKHDWAAHKKVCVKV